MSERIHYSSLPDFKSATVDLFPDGASVTLDGRGYFVDVIQGRRIFALLAEYNGKHGVGAALDEAVKSQIRGIVIGDKSLAEWLDEDTRPWQARE